MRAFAWYGQSLPSTLSTRPSGASSSNGSSCTTPSMATKPPATRPSHARRAPKPCEKTICASFIVESESGGREAVGEAPRILEADDARRLQLVALGIEQDDAGRPEQMETLE